jgi:hypothetical protein
MTTSIKTYSAIDLLDKILEFTEMTPNSTQWNLKSLKSNPPRQIRLQQIEALVNAFCVAELNQNLLNKAKSIFSNDQKISIESFLRGDFIKSRNVIEYLDLTQSIKDFVKTKTNNVDQTRDIRIEQLVFIFRQLIDFKRKIRNLLTFNSGWLEASSVTSLFSIYLTDSISNELTGKYNELDNVIEQLINPKNLTFTQEELIDKFDFPIANLNDIDMDFA